jgi:endonuclease YncB( thermonuclease family)
MIRPAAAVALLFALVVEAVAAPPTTATGKVVSVHDGDTLTLRTDDGRTLKVRLQGIDAPELGQPFGKRSRDELAAGARAARKGLWSDPAPVAPWEWRSAEQARRNAKSRTTAGAR